MTFAIMMLTKDRPNYFAATIRNLAVMKMPEKTHIHIWDNSNAENYELNKNTANILLSNPNVVSIGITKPKSEHPYAALREAVEWMIERYEWFFYTDDDILYHPETFVWCNYVAITTPETLKVGQIVPCNTMIEFWIGEQVGVRRAFGAGRSYNNSKFIKMLIDEFKPDNSNNMFDQLSEKYGIGHHYADYIYLGAPWDMTFHYGLGVHTTNKDVVATWLPHYIGDQEEAKKCLTIHP